LKRGYLIMSLLLISLMLVICLGLLLRQPLGLAQANLIQEGLQARFLAESGQEHLRVQLMNDWTSWKNHETAPLSYLERVPPSGHYRVTLDRRWEAPPYSLLRVESEGLLGDPDNPRIRYLIESVIDVQPTDRGGSANPNPDFFQFIEWNERTP